MTYHHFTSPRWVLKQGGWENAETVKSFARYARIVTQELGEHLHYVCTMNEPNLADLLATYNMVEKTPAERANNPMWVGVGKELGITPDKVSGFQLSGTEEAWNIKRQAHHASRQAIKDVAPNLQVGWTLANSDIQPLEGAESFASALIERVNLRYLAESMDDDFIGIQTYNRNRYTANGQLAPAPEGAVTNEMGEELWPWAIGNTVRQAWDVTHKPILVTENGVATSDDSQREEFLRTAISEVGKAISDGVDVIGYMCWSAFDNFEWIFGYTPRYGIIAVDRATQQRTVKPSGYLLGRIATTNGACLI